MRRDPVRGELRREYDRIWTEGRRRAGGVPERRWGAGAWRGDHTLWGERREGSLPPEPLAEALEAYMRRYEIDYVPSKYGTVEGGIKGDLAERAGVSERRIYSVLHRETNVSLVVADRIAVALGTHVDALYV